MTSVTLISAHRTIHLRHGGLGAYEKIGWVLRDCELITGLVLLHTYIHTACLKVVGSSPGAAIFFHLNV